MSSPREGRLSVIGFMTAGAVKVRGADGMSPSRTGVAPRPAYAPATGGEWSQGQGLPMFITPMAMNRIPKSIMQIP
jgi:hypothetical protein